MLWSKTNYDTRNSSTILSLIGILLYSYIVFETVVNVNGFTWGGISTTAPDARHHHDHLKPTTTTTTTMMISHIKNENRKKSNRPRHNIATFAFSMKSSSTTTTNILTSRRRQVRTNIPQALSLLPTNGETINDQQGNAVENDESTGNDTNGIIICALDWDNLASPYMSSMDSESTFLEFTDDGICVPAGPVGQWKERLANILAEPIVELIIAASVLVNSLLVALSTLDDIDVVYRGWIRQGELGVSFVFCLDFFGRWFASSKDQGKHVLDAQFALDVLVVILPLVIGLTPKELNVNDSQIPSTFANPSELFNLELLRVLRLRRVLKDLPTFERFAERALLGVAERRTVNQLVQEWQLQLARVLLSLFTLVSVASGLVYTAENAVNPSINNYFDALYFGLTTLTTVGFGDVSPITWQGKLIVCASILVGVAVVPAQAAALVEALLEREDLKRQSRNRPIGNVGATSAFSNGDSEDAMLSLDLVKTCSNCGSTFHWTNATFCYSCGADL